MTIRELTERCDNRFVVICIEKEKDGKDITIFKYDRYNYKTICIEDVVPDKFLDMTIDYFEIDTDSYISNGSIKTYYEIYIKVK